MIKTKSFSIKQKYMDKKIMVIDDDKDFLSLLIRLRSSQRSREQCNFKEEHSERSG